MTFEFYGKYNLDIAEFDKQHLQLFHYLYLFEGYKRKKFGIDAAVELLNEMVEFTADHFKSEEKLLKEHGYEGLESHKSEHERLLSEFHSFVKQFKTDRKAVNNKDVSFLRESVEQHLLDEDMKYKNYLKERGVD